MTDPLSPELAAWDRLTPHQQSEAARRFRTLARKIDPTHPDYNPHIKQRQIAAESGEDYASLCRWLRQWEEGLTGKDGKPLAPARCMAALAPRQPGPPRGRPLLSAERIQEIEDLAGTYMRRSGNPDRLPVTLVYQGLVAKEELTRTKAPGFSQVRDTLHRVTYPRRLAWAGGPEYLKKYGGLPRLTVPAPEAPNIEWYLDQWVADVFVLYEDGETGRPVIVTVIDRFGGGFALGLAIHRRFTGFTVSEAVTAAISRNGKPHTIRLDLGKENWTKYLRSGCEFLVIELAATTPHDPSVKGLMEGVHNSYRQFSQRLPWHAPSDILTKPLREEPPLPFAEFCERFTTYVFGEYNTRPYTGQNGRLGQSRLELRQAAAFTPVIPAEQELKVLFAKATEVTVRSQGITLRRVTYYHPALGRRIGEKVLARQGREDVDVIVHDRENHFICVAQNALAQAAGLNDETRREFTADRRALAKAETTLADAQIKRGRDQTDWLALKARQNITKGGGKPPRPSVRQITPLTGETPQAQAVAGRRLKHFRYE